MAQFDAVYFELLRWMYAAPLLMTFVAAFVTALMIGAMMETWRR